jgi:hypothetical protein
VLLRAGAVATAIRPIFLLVSELPQAIHRLVCDKYDIPTTATVSSVGAASGHVLLTPKVDEPMPPVTGFDMNACRIDQ